MGQKRISIVQGEEPAKNWGLVFERNRVDSETIRTIQLAPSDSIADTRDALRLEAQAASLLVVDHCSVGADTHEAISEIRTQYPSLPIVFLAQCISASDCLNILAHGASSVICIPESNRDLDDLILHVSSYWLLANVQPADLEKVSN
jgi:DNA-binding NarL/FixJ family response regulator